MIIKSIESAKLWLSVSVIVLLIPWLLLNTKAAQNTPAETPLADSKLTAFNQELLSTLETQHKKEIEKIEGVSQQLKDYMTGFELKQKLIADLQATLDKVLAEQAARQAVTQTPERPEDEFYNHLLQDHQFDATGYDLEQMKIIDNNLHAGYPALGVTPQVQYYTTPAVRFESFRTGLFRSRFCLGGFCK